MIYHRAFFHSENVCNLLLLDDDLAPSCEDQWNLCLAREGYIEYVASWELSWCPGKIAGNPDRLYRWPQCCYHPETQNPSGDLEGCLFKYASKGTCQKRFSGFFPLRGGGYPPFSLRVFGHNDFPLRGGVPPNSVKEKIR